MQLAYTADMKYLLPALLALVSASNAASEEIEAEGRVVSAALFKNGLAFVTREVAVQGAGTYALSHVPAPHTRHLLDRR